MAAPQTYRAEYAAISRWSFGAQAAALVLAAVSGALYLARETTATGRVAVDWPFVATLTAASAILLIGEGVARAQFLHHGLIFLSGRATHPEADPAAVAAHRELSRAIYSSRNRILAGLAYAAFLASAPFVFAVWTQHPQLRAPLAAFIAPASFITGNTIYSWCMYLGHSRRLAQRIEMSVWDARNAATESYVKLMLTIAVFASVAASLSMTSVLFSVFNEQDLVVGYCVGCIALMAVSIFYLYAPIVDSLASSKRAWIGQIGARLQALAGDLVKDARGPDGEALFDEMQRLLKLKDVVGKVSVIPFGRLSLSAFALMASALSHPLVLNWLMSIGIMRPSPH